MPPYDYILTMDNGDELAVTKEELAAIIAETKFTSTDPEAVRRALRETIYRRAVVEGGAERRRYAVTVELTLEGPDDQTVLHDVRRLMREWDDRLEARPRLLEVYETPTDTLNVRRVPLPPSEALPLI